MRLRLKGLQIDDFAKHEVNAIILIKMISRLPMQPFALSSVHEHD